MVKVKICGITNLEDAQASVGAGCDALGFVFYKKSPRYISPEKASEIIGRLPKDVVKIGVFADAKEKTIRRIAGLCGLDMLQFHGSESPKFCSKFKDYKIIKAFKVKNKIDIKGLFKYSPFAYLFDTYSESKIGGTGRSFDWKLIRHIADINRPVFISGGLTAENVREAIRQAGPQWVDVCSSVEESPGKKDHRKVKRFIDAAKE